MIGRALGLPLGATLVDVIRGYGRQGDLPATPEPGRQMQLGYALLASVTVPIVLATAETHLGPGIRYLDVVALCAAYALVTVAMVAMPWARLDTRWSLAAVALPAVFVASLSALTGAGTSPYTAIYAPVLAIAGWYLPFRYLAATIGLVVATELWRAVALDGSRSIEQLTIMLPFDLAVAIAAFTSSTFLRRSLTSTRLDQVQMAATLEAIRGLGMDPDADVLHDLERAMQRVFDARATVVKLDTERPGIQPLAPVILEGNIATVLVPGVTRLHALVTLEGRRPFSNQELRLAAILAEAAGRTVDVRDATPGARDESDRDYLTGLMNRRALERDIAEELAGSAEQGAVALMLVDLDGFKALNDRHGHAAGDGALVHMADVLMTTARRLDRVYRTGGDEFAVLIRRAGEEEGTRMADRVIRALANPKRRAREIGVPDFSVSIAVAVPSPDWSPTELFEAAQATMVRAKAAGGGVVHLYAKELSDA